MTKQEFVQKLRELNAQADPSVSKVLVDIAASAYSALYVIGYTVGVAAIAAWFAW